MAYERHFTPDGRDRHQVSAPKIARPVADPDGAREGVALTDFAPSPVNYVVLSASVVVIAAIVAATIGLHAYQVGKIAEDFRERGAQARETGDFEAAVDHLQRYLAIAPDDIDAVEDLAFSIEATADSAQEQYRASQMFERILRDSPDSTAVRTKLAELYVELGTYPTEVRTSLNANAIEHLNRLLVSDPANANLLAQRAECQERIGRFEEARDDYAAAIDLNPRDLELYAKLVRLLSNRLEKPDDALDRLNELVQRNPKNADAYLARSQFQWEQGRVRESRIDAVRAYRLEPENRDVLISLVNLSAFSDWPSQPLTMEELKSRLLSQDESQINDESSKLALVDLAVLTGDYAEAERRLEAILEDRPDWDTALQVYADVLILTGRQKKADEIIAKLEDQSGGDSNLSRFLRAVNAFSRQEWPVAAELFRRVFESTTTGPFVRTTAGLNLAACYREMGQSLREQQACQDVLAANPNSSDAVMQLADSYLRSGNLEEARLQFERLPDNPAAVAAVARIVTEENRTLPAAEQRWDQVDSALRAATQVQSSSADAVLLRSQMLLAKGEHEQAIALLSRAVQEQAGDARLWLQLIEAELSRGNWDAAEATLARADEALQRPDVTRVARISLAVARQDSAMLDELMQSVSLAADPDGEIDSDVYRTFARAWQDLGDFDKAGECWNIVRQHHPYDINVLQSLVVLALIEADDSRASGLIQQMREIEGAHGIRWRMAEVERLLALVERGQHDQVNAADKILRELGESMPASADVSARRGDVARLQSHFEEALQHYQSAINQGSPSRNCVLQMAGILFQRGEFAEVGRLIRQFEKSAWQGLDPQLARLGAFASLQEDSPLEAVRFARLGTDLDSASYEDLITLGQFQQIAGQQEQAEASFRRAVEMVPERPDAWIALVTFLTASERRDQVAAVISEAEAAVAADLADLTLAQCYEVIGDQERAGTHYERLTKTFAGDPRQLRVATRFYVRTDQRQIAREFLESVLSENSGETTPATFAARRLLAVVLADSSEYTNRRRALELLNQNLAVPNLEESRQDTLLKARLLALSRLARDRRTARELFETLAATAPLPIRDAQQLAALHREIGETEMALQVATSLVGRTHRNPDVLAWAIDFVLSTEQSGFQLEVLEKWSELLAAVRPNGLQTRILRARSMIHRGHPEEALSFLKSINLSEHAEAGGSDPNTPDAVLRLAIAVDRMVQQLDRNGQLGEAEDFALFAEELYRRALPDRSASLLLIQFLTRRWRVDEAVQLSNQLQGEIPDERLALVYVNLLRTQRLGAEDAAQIRNWLQEKRDENPASPTITLCCAHAASLAGNYEQAETLHRRVVELDPDNIEALNELALLSALQHSDLSEAMQSIEHAITQAGPLGMLLDTRATVELANQQLDESEKSAQAAVADSPAAIFYFHLAQAQLALGKRDPARDSLRTAFQHGLHANSMHPLERPALKQLQSELEL